MKTKNRFILSSTASPFSLDLPLQSSLVIV